MVLYICLCCIAFIWRVGYESMPLTFNCNYIVLVYEEQYRNAIITKNTWLYTLTFYQIYKTLKLQYADTSKIAISLKFQLANNTWSTVGFLVLEDQGFESKMCPSLCLTSISFCQILHCRGIHCCSIAASWHCICMLEYCINYAGNGIIIIR